MYDTIVSPSEFEVGAWLQLRCKVIDVRSGSLVPSGFIVRFYFHNGSFVGEDDTDGNGVASVNYHYIGGPYAFKAETHPDQAENKKFASTTVM